MILTLLIAISVVIAVLLLRSLITPAPAAGAAVANTRPARVTKKKAKKAVSATQPYHAVSCRPGTGSCEAAKALDDKRFLAKNAPHLPLAACTAERCKCKYVHYEDRRDLEEDRRALYGMRHDFFEHSLQQDRRKKRGRRTDDWDA